MTLIAPINSIHRTLSDSVFSVLSVCLTLQTFYGDLTLADGHYGGSKGRRWKVDWDKTPQPIQIKVKCLRGVKDKLPCRCQLCQ